MGKCRDCIYCYTNETMGTLYICVNGNSDNFTYTTGLCCENACKDCVEEDLDDRM